ncbi:hypothetical protein C3F42_25130 [Pseudomonas sp. PONIH3]|nr:hypothetical protein C3F42_25130 [Pseudomonas sp. PONIH3]
MNGGALFNAEFGIRHSGSTVPERSGVALSFCRRQVISLLLLHISRELSISPAAVPGASVISCRFEEISTTGLSLECHSLARGLRPWSKPARLALYPFAYRAAVTTALYCPVPMELPDEEARTAWRLGAFRVFPGFAGR